MKTVLQNTGQETGCSLQPQPILHVTIRHSIITSSMSSTCSPFDMTQGQNCPTHYMTKCKTNKTQQQIHREKSGRQNNISTQSVLQDIITDNPVRKRYTKDFVFVFYSLKKGTKHPKICFATKIRMNRTALEHLGPPDLTALNCSHLRDTGIDISPWRFKFCFCEQSLPPRHG